jgi:uncharacterized protein (DUF924 family)
MEQYEQILKFWFGHVEQTIVPSENRARIWFGDSPAVDSEIKQKFNNDLEKAIQGAYTEWEKSPRGQLALIIMLDQFSRHIYRDTPKAYAQDDFALSICIQGMSREDDHQLSLIERVFYYFPLLHSEHVANQEKSIRAYQMLVEVAFQETQVIYESFFKFAMHHFNIVQRFGRFPQRNALLGRESTPEEAKFLKDIKQT